MLTVDDIPTIRHALVRRLDSELNVRTGEIKILPPGKKSKASFIHVEVECFVGPFMGEPLRLFSAFHLPPSFEHSHLLNEIDEIAESCKAAWADYWKRGRTMMGPMHHLPGTGLRGRWASYG